MAVVEQTSRAHAPWLDAAFAALESLHRRGVHAVLLHGPRGTGKWNLAMRFARRLACRQPNEQGEACQQCADCRWFDAGHHPDIRVIVPDAWADRRPGGAEAGPETEAQGAADGGGPAAKGKPSRELKIDAVRALSGLLQVSPHRPDGCKVVVMAPLEQLNEAAANALLKNLEEPPGQTRFVLATDRLDRCLPTVISRCSLVRVAVPEPGEGLAWLSRQGLAPAEAAKALVHAGGAPLRALELSGQSPAGADEAALVGLLKLGAAMHSAQIVVQVPRQIELVSAVAVLQRWAWDWMAVCLGAAPRYFPDEAGALRLIGTPGRWPHAQGWSQSLLRLAMTAEHPLNAKLAIEQALIDYQTALAA